MKRIIFLLAVMCLLACLMVGCAKEGAGQGSSSAVSSGTDMGSDVGTDSGTVDNGGADADTNSSAPIGGTDTSSTVTSGSTDISSGTGSGSIDTGSSDIGSVDSDTGTQSSDIKSETGSSTDISTEIGGKEDIDESKPNDPNKKQNWADDGELKILAIGNSFSDDAMEYVYQVAKDAGVEKITLGNMFIGGCSLATHLSNAKGNKNAYTYRTNTNGTWQSRGGVSIQTAVTAEDWDFITFQQVSGYSGVASSYDDLVELISIVEPLNPSARLAWHMTWAYKVGSSHSDFGKYNRDQMTMYNAITSAVNEKILTNEKIEIVIPSGTSIQNVRTSLIGDMTRDGYHLSYGIGRYIASMTFVKALTGLSIDNSKNTPDDVDSYELLAIIEGVNNALKTPYAVTESSYPLKKGGPGIDDSENAGTIPEGYVQLTASQMGLTEGSFYNTTGTDSWNGTSGWNRGFMATKKFTREELPVGSIIEIKVGWQYRPEGWNFAVSRQDNVTTLRIIIDEDWWGSYTERGFNISQIGHSTSSNKVITLSTEEVAQTVFKIFVPEEALTKAE